MEKWPVLAAASIIGAMTALFVIVSALRMAGPEPAATFGGTVVVTTVAAH
ncbi:MAG: hypothetical protein ACRDV3_00930 [Acidothermaceae bacterium]